LLCIQVNSEKAAVAAMETLEGAAKDHCMPEFLPAPPWTGRGQEQAARFVPQSMLEANTCESCETCRASRAAVR